MSAPIFNGPDLVIKFPSVGTFEAAAFYSAWKEWLALGDNAKFPPAFDTVGGDSVGGGQEIAPYFFARNDLGWRIEMPDENGEIILQGNIFPRDPIATLFQQAPGFDAFLRLEVSSKAVVVNVSGGAGGLTPDQEAKLNLIPALL